MERKEKHGEDKIPCSDSDAAVLFTFTMTCGTTGESTKCFRELVNGLHRAVILTEGGMPASQFPLKVMDCWKLKHWRCAHYFRKLGDGKMCDNEMQWVQEGKGDACHWAAVVPHRKQPSGNSDSRCSNHYSNMHTEEYIV